jgi:anti-sigma factor RsiW
VLCPESLRVQAYFDGEVDAVTGAEMERHVEHCAECRALLSQLQQLRSSLRRNVPHAAAPAALVDQVQAALDAEDDAAAARPRRAVAVAWRARSFWVGAVSGMVALAAGFALFVSAPLFTTPLVNEIAAAHVGSLMSSHLVDVVSTDHHTVKPWFAGRTPVSPVVADFAAQGYALMGGRMDAIDQQRAAVVVYKHGAHLISVYCWSAPRRALPGNATRNGYHLSFWKSGDLAYAAVSDTAWDELLGLERLLRERAAQDAPP